MLLLFLSNVLALDQRKVDPEAKILGYPFIREPNPRQQKGREREWGKKGRKPVEGERIVLTG